MIVGLTRTADGLQLILHGTKDVNGSILADQSMISRTPNNAEQGWWAWGAAAGSWAPVNVMTRSEREMLRDPAEKVLETADKMSAPSQTKSSPKTSQSASR
jgi:hypothetical protein